MVGYGDGYGVSPRYLGSLPHLVHACVFIWCVGVCAHSGACSLCFSNFTTLKTFYGRFFFKNILVVTENYDLGIAVSVCLSLSLSLSFFLS